MKLWRCPTCGDQTRAPSKMRTLDPRRYCLRCSVGAPLLVARVCPSLERAAEVREAKRKAVKTAQKERAIAKRALEDSSPRASYLRQAQEWCKLEAWEGAFNPGKTWNGFRFEKGRPRITIRLSPRNTFSSGHAWPDAHRMVVTCGTDLGDALAVILHELAHLAAGPRQGHNDRWRTLFVDSVSEVTGVSAKEITAGAKSPSHRSLTTSAAIEIAKWCSASSAYRAELTQPEIQNAH